MSLFLILIVILVLALLAMFALILGGWWEAPPQLKEAVMGLKPHKADPPERFKAWALESLGDHPELQAWLSSLSDEGMRALTQRVSAFCADLNMQLSWLVLGHLDAAPHLRQTAQAIVADYLEICRRAIERQPDIVLFGSFHKVVENVADGRYRDLRRKLFTRLTAEGLAEPLPSYELIMASETQRQAMAAKAIRQAAAKDWREFARVFETVTGEDAAERAAKAAHPAAGN
jgi:hypothetical protein